MLARKPRKELLPLRSSLLRTARNFLKERPRNKDGEDLPRGTSLRRGGKGWRVRKFLKGRRGRMARNFIDARKFFASKIFLEIRMAIKCDVIYFNFAKPFDSVSHDLILKKLKHSYRIDGLMLRFIKSYLENRKQQVVIGGAISSTLPVKSGVPQGSILGPLLFVLFINDMFTCVSKETNMALYADDTKIRREIFISEDHLILKNDIDNLYKWSVDNEMNFHPSKCKALSLTDQRNILHNLPFTTFHYYID